MLLGGALGQFPLGGGPTGTVTVATISWYQPASEPVRQKRGLRPSQQQFLAFQAAPSPFVATGWYEPLPEPKRHKRGLRPDANQFLAFQPMPSPFVATGWYEQLSEPQRKKQRSDAALYPNFAYHPAPSPFVATGWYEPLSEPKRFKEGLKSGQQQYLAWPPQLRPTPTVTGVLNALETKDAFLAGAMIWNRATNTEIGVVNTTPQPAEIGLYPAAQTAGTITVRISIIIG